MPARAGPPCHGGTSRPRRLGGRPRRRQPTRSRKSPTGPIEAVAQDGGLAAWLTFGGTPRMQRDPRARRRQAGPQPSPAVAGQHDVHTGISPTGSPARARGPHVDRALDAARERPAPFDYVLAASVGGPERARPARPRERRHRRLARQRRGRRERLSPTPGTTSSTSTSSLASRGATASGRSRPAGSRIVTPTGECAAAQRRACTPARRLGRSHRLRSRRRGSRRIGAGASTNGFVNVVDGTSGNAISQRAGARSPGRNRAHPPHTRRAHATRAA